MKNRYVTYEEFIAGALMYFRNLDAFDIFLLIENFELETAIEVRNIEKLKDLGQYIGIDDNGIVGLKKDYHMKKPLIGGKAPLKSLFRERVPSVI